MTEAVETTSPSPTVGLKSPPESLQTEQPPKSPTRDIDSLDAAGATATTLENSRAIRKQLELKMTTATARDHFEAAESSSDSSAPSATQAVYQHDNDNMAQRAFIDWHPDPYWDDRLGVQYGTTL